MRNLFVNFKGGATSRAGTAFVGRSKQIPGVNSPPWLIPFAFNINQGYVLEFGDNYMRVVSNGAYVLEAAKTITGATQANPCVITTSTPHGFASNDWVFINGVLGMTQLNANTYRVNALTATTFGLLDLDGNNVNATGFTAYTSGGGVSRIFTLTTPYVASDMPLVKYTQSADVMSLTHPNYPPQELKRFATNNWTITAASFAALITAPTNVSVIATVQPTTATTPHILPCSYGYVITAVDAATAQESIGTPMAVVTNGVDMSVTAGSNVVAWTGVTGAAYYNVYRTLANYNTKPASTTDALPPPAGSITGYVGFTFSTQFIDSNITPDLAQVPPVHRNPFAPGQILWVTMTNGGTLYATGDTVTVTSGTGSGFSGIPVIIGGIISAVVVLDPGHDYRNTDTVVFTSGTGSGATATLNVGPLTGTYPGCVAYFQERRAYAQTLNQPDTLWFSHPGDFLNFDTRIPSQADDAITVTPFAQEVNGIQFLVTMPGGLVVLTGLQAYQILGPGSFGATSVQAITPSSIAAVPQAYNGINTTVPPVVINYDILYIQSRGSVVRDLSYNFFANIYTGTDLTVLSSHLFQGYTITSWAWCEEPYKLLWMVRNDGTLLSLTFLKEQEISAWARHDTQGNFICLAQVSEPPVNALYAVVERPYNPTSGSIFCIERMDNRLWNSVEDSWCVDCAVSTPLIFPASGIVANAASGAGVTFISLSSIWVPAHVGQTIRMGGGIATITSYVSASQVIGTWLFPCQNTIPNTILPRNQPAGAWSVTVNVTTIGGLQHLVGQFGYGVADGVPIGPLTVSASGNVTLPFAASDVKIGFPFTAQLQSIYLDDGQPTAQGRRKSIQACTVRVADTGNFKMGTNQVDGSTLSPPVINPAWSSMFVVPSQGSTYTSPGGQTVNNLFTGDEYKNLQAAWRRPGQVAMQQDLPLPMTILDIVPMYNPGDLPEAVVTPESEKQQRQPQQPRG
jgi:hypothetical protein